MTDIFQARDILTTSYGEYVYYRLGKLEENGLTELSRLPYSIRVLLESVMRQCDERNITSMDVINLAGWEAVNAERPSLPFRPQRVVMQDFTGVPAVVDLAAMRSAMARLGGDAEKINPVVPVDLVIDHSVQVDFFASPGALRRNAELEFQRNRERYEFLHWGQSAFNDFRVVPPATGIVHQVNLEYLASVVMTQEEAGQRIVFPDTLVGTDSHTTMINGLGIVGWGVGGIEAEAAMLGKPIDMVTPDVIGFGLYGSLREGVTATDLTLTVTQMLREWGVVEKFVEFFGPGLSSMSLPDRATIANMAPEYGATMGFFPVDDETLRYLRLTGRSAEQVELIEQYCKSQGLFRNSDSPDPEFSDTLYLNLEDVQPSVAGPKRPQDRIPLYAVKDSFKETLSAPVTERGFGLGEEEITSSAVMGTNGGIMEMSHGAVVIAAITSCTNTSNPSVMVAAGLVAKKAVERGLQVKPYVKTSLAPGSRVVTDYLEGAGLLVPLAELGFNIVGYGCTTCIGNSGPLPSEVVKAITSADLVAAAVLSGNRNFEGRIHPYVRANFLASPPLVVAYALAGTVDINLAEDSIGEDHDGNPVFLRDIWPSRYEIQDAITGAITPEIFEEKYANVFKGNPTWNQIESQESELYPWDPESTYIQEPPFFIELTPEVPHTENIHRARVLALLGDSITTDHISPAGTFSPKSPAGEYLMSHGIEPRDFNTYGSRRGNDRVMTRGTFANIRLKNSLVPGSEGGVTRHFPDGEQMSIYEAAIKYQDEGVPLIVIAGKEYGTGSSRDWAAKGTLLLGVKAVVAESFERIHRSNLVGMGVLPLEFIPGENLETFGLTGEEVYDIVGIDDDIEPMSELTVRVEKPDGDAIKFKVIVRLNTPIEVNYCRNGGILQTVLRSLLAE
jgi:aconitate hydratase